MDPIVIVFVVVIVIMLIALFLMYSKMNKLNSENSRADEKLPYILNDKILTNKEYKFYESLKPIADKNGYIIMCKVRLADIVSIPSGTKDYTRYFNFIKAKHIDFLLCDGDTAPLFAIEVDDKTHERADRVKRDEFLNRVFSDKKVKLMRYNKWSIEQLESDFSRKIENPEKTAE